MVGVDVEQIKSIEACPRLHSIWNVWQGLTETAQTILNMAAKTSPIMRISSLLSLLS